MSEFNFRWYTLESEGQALNQTVLMSPPAEPDTGSPGPDSESGPARGAEAAAGLGI